MSDHISGPRALAEPIADITDVFAFPSPETPGALVLVVNTLPFAPPEGRFSDGLIYRFRLRQLARYDGPPGSAPFEVGAEPMYAARSATGSRCGWSVPAPSCRSR